MKRRDFIKVSGIGAAALVLPVSLLAREKYVGDCQCICEHCTGKDSKPLSHSKNGIRIGSIGPTLCEYHGALVYKLKCLTLPQMESLARNKNCQLLVRDTVKMVMASPGERVKLSTSMHEVRLIAMNVSDEYFVKHHRKIFGC
jgi:hypothetical protein